MGRENGAGEAYRTCGLREIMDHAMARHPACHWHISISWHLGLAEKRWINQCPNISWDIAWDIDYIWLLSMTGVLFTSIVNIWGQTCWDFGWLWATRRWRGHHKCIEILKTPREQWQPRDAKGIAETCWNTLHLAFVTMFAFTGVLTERYLSGAVCHHCFWPSNGSAKESKEGQLEIWCATLQLLKHHINKPRIKIN